MVEPNEPIESLLLDWHLNQLEEPDAKRVEQAVAGSPELAAQSKSLRFLLNVLDSIESPAPSADLPDRIMARLNAEAGVLRLPDQSAGNQAAPSISEPAIRGYSFRLRDLVAVAACIAFLVLLAVPGFLKSSAVSMRHLCLNNQRMVVDGMQRYAQANNGYLPFRDYIPGGTWRADPMSGQRMAPNTRHIYVLVSQKYVNDNRVFLCPADRQAQLMMADDYKQFDDFPERLNNSYSYQYMNRIQPARLADLRSDGLRGMVLVADRSPLADRTGGPGCRISDRGLNSSLHKGVGQNAVFTNASGGWFTTRQIGVNQDDIYGVASLQEYQGTEEPELETDTFLAP